MSNATAPSSAIPNGSGSMDDTIDRLISTAEAAGTASATSQTPYIKSPKWSGAKAGYYFGTVDGKTGYYLDRNAPGNRKRPLQEQDGGDGGEGAATKSSVTAMAGVGGKKRPRTTPKTGAELLAEAEHELERSDIPAPRVLELSGRGLRAAASALDRTVHKNELKRAEFPDDPSQFMESELALNDEIVAWKSVASELRLYPNLVALGVTGRLLGLLHHENMDVGMSVLSLFVELLDPALLVEEGESVDGEGRSAMGSLCNSLVDGSVLETIVGTLGRLDDKEEEDVKGMDDVLTIVEALLDLDSVEVLQEAANSAARDKGMDNGEKKSEDADAVQSIAARILRGTPLLAWLLDRTSRKGPFTALKLHASEVLASLIQHDDAQVNVSDLASLVPFRLALDDDEWNSKPKAPSKTNGTDKEQMVDGVEMLLQSIAPYRKKHPESEEECECLDNCLDALAASLLNPKTVETFLEAQGIELLLRCVREKVHAGGGSLTALYFAVSGSDEVYKRACETFVDVGGLRVLFPVFMTRGSAIPRPARCTDAGRSDGGQKKEGDKKPSKRTRRAVQARKEWLTKVEVNAIQIAYALTRHLDERSPNEARERLLVKFVESDCEKCDRLVELCLKYDEKMRLAEYRYYRSDEAEEAEKSGLDVDLGALNAKLRGGGDMFHRVGAIMAFACVGSKRCHEHLLEQLKVKNSGIGVLKAALEEFASLLDEGDQKEQLRSYLSSI